jgi:hypothetical protein
MAASISRRASARLSAFVLPEFIWIMETFMILPRLSRFHAGMIARDSQRSGKLASGVSVAGRRLAMHGSAGTAMLGQAGADTARLNFGGDGWQTV